MKNLSLGVTVVLPTHDRPQPLGKAVRSILNQTFPPLEIIIVNDGDDEIDPALADEITSAAVKFQYLRQDHASSTASRNRGMAASGGDIVLLMDDDVILPDDYLARLVDLYRFDQAGLVDGIGGLYAEDSDRTLGRRVWDVMSVAFGSICWKPRVIVSRYRELNLRLRGLLAPAGHLVGGAISLRGNVARNEKFEEFFTGYTFGEDMEFSYRLGGKYALFVARRLRVVHDKAPGGRPEMYNFGKMYVKNSLHIVSTSLDGGAGTCLLVGYDFFGMMILYTIWGVATLRGENLRYSAGMAAELCSWAWRLMGKMICGS